MNKSPSFRDALTAVRTPYGYSTPPERRPNLWDNARFVLADFAVKRKEANKILPLGMWLGAEPKATLFIVDYTKTSFTVPYHEAALLLHVHTPMGKGLHCPWMIVDDDTAMIYGRELLGYPKKFADFVFKEDNGYIEASLTRRGVEVLRFESKNGASQPSPAPVFDKKTFNVGGPLQLLYLQPIWMFRPKEVIRESYETEAKVTINESEYDPIARYLAGEATNTRMVVLDITGARYYLPVGAAWIKWFIHSYFLRYR
jgi:acetoacetate decarboxylase